MSRGPLTPVLAAALLVTSGAPTFPADGVLSPGLFAELRWRPIGPFRGGRTKAATGVPGRPGLFYIGVVNGGVWRTTDSGRTWRPIFDDQPTGSIGALAVAPSNPDVIYVGSGEGMQRPIVNAVREGPKRRDLLYAGTERQFFVSFDGGDRWQSLRVNMPATSIRDLVVKDADLVAGTHGRGFWILDDVTPRRQVSASVLGADSHLFAPANAVRFRWSKNTDTPLPPDEPAAPNPPDGAVIDYHLKAAAKSVALEVLDASGRLVRRYTSADREEPPVEGRNIPDYWIRPPRKLSADAGLHRFVWDLRHETPAASSFSYPIAAVPGNTPREPRGPWVVPETYTVRLSVDGRVSTQPLTVTMDPRVKTPPADVEAQHAIAMRLCEAMARARDARHLDDRTPTGEAPDGVRRLHGQLTQLLDAVEDVDALPTPAVQAAVDETIAALDAQLARVQEENR